MAHNYVMICGYDNYGTGTTDILRKFAAASSATISTTNTPFGVGRSLNAGFGCTFTLPATTDKLILGHWVYADLGGRMLVFGALQSSTYQFSVFVEVTGKISVYRGNAVTFLAQTTGQVVWPNSWFHLEVKSRVNSSISSGDFVVYVNGISVLSLSATTNTQATGTANMDQVIYGTGFITSIFDDTFMVDWSSGDTTQVGVKRVITLTPSGNGTTSNFVGSDSDSTNNYLLVDDVPVDVADYTESITPGDVDLYAMTDLSVTPTSVPVVQITNLVAKSDAGARTARNIIRSGGTNYDTGVDISPGTGYVFYSDRWYTDPQDSAAWTGTKVNALEAGIKIQA